MNTQPVGYKAKAFELRSLIFLFLLALLMAACSPASLASQPPEATPIAQRLTD